MPALTGMPDNISETLYGVGSYWTSKMAEIHDILSQTDGTNEEKANLLYQQLENHLKIPRVMNISNDVPYESEDQTGDWIIVEIDMPSGEQASIYALEGGVFLQMYDGERFLKPVDNMSALNHQVKTLR